MRYPVGLAAVAFSLIAGSAVAQPASQADQSFAARAASTNIAEMQLGQLGTQKAATPIVQAVASRMIRDHQQAADALQEIAQQQSLTLPSQPSPAEQAQEDRLRPLHGRAFDVAFVRDVIDDHKRSIADFQREAQSGRNPALRAYAQKYLPVMQEHLKLAENISWE